ncbi:MAG: nucleotidyltransferase family protein, partial [Halioglobus sp.]
MGVVNTLDIHHKITNAQWLTQQLEYSELKDNSIQIDYNDQKVPVLTPLYALIHACIHRMTNKSNDIENRLIWLYDIHLLSQKLTQQDWDNLLLIAAEKQLSAIVSESLAVTQYALATTIPAQVTTDLEKITNSQTAQNTGADRRITNYITGLLDLKGGGKRWRYLKELLFPPTAYVMAKYGAENKALLPWYYLKRIIDVIVKK